MITRRDFVALSVALSGNLREAARAAAIPTSEIDADPTGKTDSTRPIQLAIAKSIKGSNHQLTLPKGNYTLSSVEDTALRFNKVSGFVLDGSGSTLVLSKDVRWLSIVDSSNIMIKNLAIDWDPLPFTQGVVTETSPESFVLRIDPGFAVPTHQEILCFASYDRQTKNYTKKQLEAYGAVRDIEQVNPNSVRIHLKYAVDVKAGAVLGLRYKLTHEAAQLMTSHNVSFQSVQLYSSNSMGFNIHQCSNLSFDRLAISMPPGSNRLISTNADGMHITNCTGELKIVQCAFRGMGDDAININAGMWRARHDSADRHLDAVRTSGRLVDPSLLAGPKDHLELLDPKDAHAIAEATTSATSNGSVHLKLETTAENDIQDGALIADTDLIPATEISGCEFGGNRARAIVAHSNLRIENCKFQNTTGPAILLAPDLGGLEGPATKDVLIQGNQFSGCHYTSSRAEGSIAIDVGHDFKTHPLVPKGVAKSVKILSNVFESCPTAAITCRSVDQLFIEGNKVGRTWAGAESSEAANAMILTELTRSVVSGNTSTAANAIVIQQSSDVKISDNPGFTINSQT